MDLAAVYPRHHVALLEAGAICRLPRHDLPYFRRCRRDGVSGKEEHEEHKDGEKNVEKRARKSNRKPCGRRLVGVGPRSFFLRHYVLRRLAEHFHVAPERHGGDGVFRLASLEAQELLAEAERKSEDLHPHEAGNEKMAELVDEYKDAQYDDEIDSIKHRSSSGGLRRNFAAHLCVSQIASRSFISFTQGWLPSASSTRSGDIGEADPSLEKGRRGSLVRHVERDKRAVSRAERLIGESERWEPPKSGA